MLSWDSDHVDPTEATKASSARGGAPYSAALATAIEWTALRSQEGTQKAAANAGSANFTFSVPVARYPGRGQVPLALDLVYNSRLWQQTGTNAPKMIFNIDDDWPGPGWNLGFGKLVRLGGGVTMVVEPDGTRHPFAVDGDRPDGSFLLTWAHTTDGTGIRYTSRTTHDPVRRLYDGRLSRPDGSRIDFTAPSGDGRALYPTRVTDANGNAVNITYRSTGAPSIETITDTCGRVIRFHYDTGNLGVQPLVITGPGPGPAGADIELLRLQYDSLAVVHTFLEPVLEEPGTISVITGIFSPATRTGFSQPIDTYSTYGMLRQVRACRGMSIAGPDGPDAGRITAGDLSWQREYDYPDPGTPLEGPPTYTTMTATWDGQQGGPAVTRFQIETVGDITRTMITWPDNSRTEQEVKAGAGTRPAGLLDTMAVFDADGRKIQNAITYWQMAADGTPQLVETQVFNGRGDLAKTTFVYGPTATLPTVVDQWEWAHANRVLRRTETEFETDVAFLGRNLRNLPKAVRVYGPFFPGPHQVLTVASLTEFRYDETERRPTPGVVGYDDRFVAGDPAYEPNTAWRGNPTLIRRYADAAVRAAPVTETRTYDACGNVLTAEVGVGRTRYEFEVGHQYMAPSRIELTGTGSGFYAGHTVATTRYAPNGQPLWHSDSEDRRTDVAYDTAGRPTLLTFADTGATVSFDYDDSTLMQTLTVRDGETPPEVAAVEVRTFDGMGDALRARTLTPDGWDVEEYRYDGRGRLSATAAPYREGKTPTWSTTDYDALHRPVRLADPDGGITQWRYDEPAHPKNATPDHVPGSCVRITDPRGRERWQRLGTSGEVHEVVEPDPDGSGAVFPTGGLLTSYSYDPHGNVTALDLSVPGTSTQHRRFRHDSLGRLVRVHLPELGDGIVEERAGGTETWSRAWEYDERSNVTTVTDSRGVATVFDYDDDFLDRVHRVRYITKYVHDVDNPIVECPDVEYTYVNDGDPRKVMFEHALGVAFDIFRYDELGRLNSTSSFLQSAEAFPFDIEQPRDTLGRRSGIVYPALYGDASPSQRPTVGYQYAIGGLPNLLTVDGVEQASSFAYASGGRISELTVGPPGPDQVRESYAYEASHRGLTGQQLTQNGTILLNLSYLYWPATLGRWQGLKWQLRTTTDHRIGASDSRSYRYDALGRLRTAAGGTEPAWTWVEDYAYDTRGNRTTVAASGDIKPGKAAPPDGHVNLTYDEDKNQINSAGFAYDAAGNMVASRSPDGAEFRYQYDAAGRLVFAQNTATQAITGYLYGADNRRRATLRLAPGTWPPGDTPSSIWANPGRVLTGVFHVWDGHAVIAEYEDIGPRVGEALLWKDVRVFLGPRLLSHRANVGALGAQTRFEHPGLTGTRYVTGLDHAQDHEPLPFGSSTVNEGPAAQPFTTYDRDQQTGLDYAVNRFYHPAQGRFLTPDPLGPAVFDTANSQSLNLYTYCGGDPVNRTDSLGLTDDIYYWSWWEKGGYVTYTPGPDALIGAVVEVSGTPLEPGFAIDADAASRGENGGGEGGAPGAGGGPEGGGGPSEGSTGPSGQATVPPPVVSPYPRRPPSWFDSKTAREIEVLMRLIKTLMGKPIQKPPPPPPPPIIRNVPRIGGSILPIIDPSIYMDPCKGFWNNPDDRPASCFWG